MYEFNCQPENLSMTTIFILLIQYYFWKTEPIYLHIRFKNLALSEQ